MTQKAWAFAFESEDLQVYSNYFDADWYLHAYPQVSSKLSRKVEGEQLVSAALRHYLSVGWRNGFDPNPYLDTKWYLDNCPEARRAGVEPLQHYVEEGWRNGLSPSIYFDAPWYLRQYPDISAADIEPLQHYLRYGWREERNPSPYFDGSWYRRQVSPSVLQDCEPLRHYLSLGWKEGLDPNPYFDTKWRLESDPEAKRSGAEPLRHYLEKAWRDGHSPSVYFNARWYLRQYPDVAAAGVEPLLHYLNDGWREERNPNAYFDAAWYSRQVPSSVLRSREPLRHYIEEGWRAGLSPGPEFDPERYLKHSAGRRKGGVEPLKDFLMAGAAAGADPTSPPKPAGPWPKRPKPNVLRRAGGADAPAQAQCFALSPAPLVSVIVPNFNGSDHLPDLFESLKAQTYQNFEIIFVDDHSTDGSIALAERYGADRIVRSERNVGFAKANNLATPHCSGELIALLNNDMRVDANWLDVLVTAIKQDPLIAAAAPKIRFWTKFQRLTIRGASEFELEEEALVASLDYKKYFAPLGVGAKGRIRSAPINGGEAVALHVPLQARPVQLRLHTTKPQNVMVGGRDRTSTIHLPSGATLCEYRFSRADWREAYHLVNNAGSALDARLNPYDRGFGQVDDGEFDWPDELDLFCGGAVLIRRDALHRRELFISELGAYYEDSELSLWLVDQGYRIVYRPNAIVYHKHSVTTVEKSASWLTQTHRNKVIFDYLAADPETRRATVERGKQRLDRLNGLYSAQPDASDEEKRFTKTIPLIHAQIDEIVSLIDSGEARRARAPRIGVYNPYWMTLGGGEAHALDVASALSSFGRVELISQNDFDVGALAEFFGFPQLNVRKRMISKFCSELTRDYDIFVNSCYLDETPSFAKKSYFLVSFPSRLPSLAFRQSYYFLANSAYTLGWMRKFWGESTFAGEVLHPSVPSACFVDLRSKSASRRKLMLSAGRFVASGHTKNQLEIVEAFRRFAASAPELAAGWTLALAGAVNDAEYLSQVHAACEGLDVVVWANAGFEDLRRLYREASIYVHASGYGRDAEAHPELLEHFGIAVAQSLASGCVPLVFDAGGPKEIVEAAGVGVTWRSLDELAQAMGECASACSSPALSADLSQRAIAAASTYSASRTADRVRRLAMHGPLHDPVVGAA